MSGLAILLLLLIMRPLLFASLDPDVAAAQGVPVRLLGLGFMVLLAVTVSEAIMAVGALLVFALLLLPLHSTRPCSRAGCRHDLAWYRHRVLHRVSW